MRPAAERKRGTLPPSRMPAGVYIGVEIGFQGVVRRHFVPFAAFLVQADPPALALGIVVLDAHGDDGTDPGKGERHDADQRSVAQPDHGRGVDAVQQFARPRAIDAATAAEIRGVLAAGMTVSRRVHSGVSSGMECNITYSVFR
jgi:hypothetical protein